MPQTVNMKIGARETRRLGSKDLLESNGGAGTLNLVVTLEKKNTKTIPTKEKPNGKEQKKRKKRWEGEQLKLPPPLEGTR